jgi:hypothetical protein
MGSHSAYIAIQGREKHLLKLLHVDKIGYIPKVNQVKKYFIQALIHSALRCILVRSHMAHINQFLAVPNAMNSQVYICIEYL